MTHRDQGTDSTTHWLERCKSDADCGGLSCLCGTCSASCVDDDACSRFGSAARCAQPATRCSSVTAMCVNDRIDACAGPQMKDCTDTTPATKPDAADSPQCVIHYVRVLGIGAEDTCGFPIDSAAPCRAAVRCLCSTDILNPGHLDQQGCEDSWLTPGDSISGCPLKPARDPKPQPEPTATCTFADFCSQGAANATRTLADALKGFAAGYTADSAEVSAECDGLMAYY
jgi:hypothetical protein